MKDITNKQLVKKIDSLIKTSATKTDLDKLAKKIDRLEALIEKLAIATKDGFDENKKEFTNIKKELAILRYNHEEIRTKSTNTSYRFELIELQKRVNILEKKVGITK